MTTAHLTVSVPNESIRERLARVDGASFVVWDMVSSPPPELAMAVVPYMVENSILRALAGTAVSVVQSQSIGYDGVAAALPAKVAFCNAAGVHAGQEQDRPALRREPREHVECRIRVAQRR